MKKSSSVQTEGNLGFRFVAVRVLARYATVMIVILFPGLAYAQYDFNPSTNQCEDSDGNPGRNAGMIGPCGDLSTADVERMATIDLEGEDLRGLQLPEGANLDGWIAPGVDLSHARLIGASLRNADLTGANFIGAQLSEADFTHAELQDADFTRARLYRTVFACVRARRAHFDHAYLAKANFRCAYLRSAVFLTPASNRGTDFSGARLHRATLSGLSRSVILNGASFSDRTVRPEWLDSQEARARNMTRGSDGQTQYCEDEGVRACP